MKSEERKLLQIFDQLAPEQQEKLLEFAEFLAVGDEGGEGAAMAEPRELPRPVVETVTMAIRRLVRTYPMLDRRLLMAETSQYLAEHALQGRAAREVIDELEVVFASHYRKLRNEK